MPAECVLVDDKLCTECGKCEMCDLDTNKKCDNCMSCIMGEEESRFIKIEDIEWDEKSD